MFIHSIYIFDSNNINMSKQFYTNLVNPNLLYNAGNNGTVNNPMTISLDAAENSIVNLPNPSTSGEPVTLAYFNENIPDTSGFITNPFTSTVNANNNSIVNVPYISWKDAITPLETWAMTLENGGIIVGSATDNENVIMNLCINQGGTSKPYFTDMRGFPFTNVGTIGLLNGGNVFGSSGAININSPLDVNNNYIKDIQNLQFYNGGSLLMDPSDNLLYNDSIVVTSSNINGYISAANWEPTAASNLNMGTYDVKFTTGSIVLDSGDLVLNNSFAVGTDQDNDLTFDENKLLVCKANILGSIPMIDSTPGQSIGIEAANPIMFASGTISAVGIFQNPVFQVDLTMQLETVYTVDVSQTYVEIVLSNTQNPLNGTPEVFCRFSEGFNQLENGDLVCSFRTDEQSPFISILQPWSTCVAALASNFYVSIVAYSVALTNPETDYINVSSSTISLNVIAPGNQFLKNELVNVNNDCSIQTYNVSAPVQLSNGTTTINIFDYSSNTALLNNGSFYIKCNVVATNLCIKFSTFIFDNEIVTSTGSQNVIYKDASFVSCGLYLNAGVLSVEIVMNENLVALSMCKCKTKIVSPV